MVLRDTGWTAGAQVISVKLNGQEISQLRPKQIVVSDSVDGDNELLANYTGISAIGVTGAEVSFQSDGTQNHYFLIKLLEPLHPWKIRILIFYKKILCFLQFHPEQSLKYMMILYHQKFYKNFSDLILFLI